MATRGQRGVRSRASTSRSGRTQKISVSLNRSDLQALRRRANRLYDGNVSAAIAEAARRVREEEGREELLAWLGKASEATERELAAIRAEWAGGDQRLRASRRR